MNIYQQLKTDIKAFLKKHPEMSKTRLGAKAVNDGHAIFNWLQDKKMPRVETIEKLYKFMREYEKK